MDKDIQIALEGLQTDNDRVRDGHFQVLIPISENSPEKLYPHWDVFTDILRTGKTLSQYGAIHVLANLACVDRDDRFSILFKDFYALLSHESPVVACHIAGCSSKIVNANPKLESKIITILLNVDEISRCKQHELLKSYVIEAFMNYFERIKNPPKVIAFVEMQLNSDSPKTRKKAKEFLARWDS